MTPTPPTVFLIDDDASVRKALRRLLTAAGYEVEALDGADAYLDRQPPQPPACLLLDIRMPGKSGIDLQRAVQGTAHALPIIFITGHGDEDERAEAVAAGAVDVLSKPLDEARPHRGNRAWIEAQPRRVARRRRPLLEKLRKTLASSPVGGRVADPIFEPSRTADEPRPGG